MRADHPIPNNTILHNVKEMPIGQHKKQKQETEQSRFKDITKNQ
jgi:hypothetical protein